MRLEKGVDKDLFEIIPSITIFRYIDKQHKQYSITFALFNFYFTIYL